MSAVRPENVSLVTVRSRLTKIMAVVFRHALSP